VQNEYSLLSRNIEREHFPACRLNRRGALVCRVLAEGALAVHKRAIPSDNRRWSSEFAFTNRSKIDRLLNTVVRPIAERHRATIAQVAIAWVLAHEEVTSAIIGASTARQALENVSATDVELTETEIALLGDAFTAAKIDPHASRSLFARAERYLRGVVEKMAA
jgi:aryl-alcohol dehydrogenase-like predicted oxidoreductase